MPRKSHRQSFPKSGGEIRWIPHGQLREVIEKTLAFIPEKERKEAVKKSCQRSFQALRIDVNSEFEVLYQFLEKLPDVLKDGGKAAILTFHSGEDRLVKKSFKQLYKQGVYREISKDVIRPSAEECNRNSQVPVPQKCAGQLSKRSRMMIKACIFDLDGTLADTLESMV